MHFRQGQVRTQAMLLAACTLLTFTWAARDGGEIAAAATSAPSARTTVQGTLTVRTVVDGVGWRLTAAQVPTNKGVKAGAGVAYDLRSRMGILAYADVTRREGPAAFTGRASVPALVTFRKPIPFDRFRQLMSLPGVTVKSYRIRSILPDGQRGTLTGAPEPDGRILDDGHVQRLLDGAKGRTGRQDTVAGVVDAEVVIDTAAYAQLTAAQTEVFLVDTMRGVAYTYLQRAGIRDVTIEEIRLQGPYWYMEDFGLTG